MIQPPWTGIRIHMLVISCGPGLRKASTHLHIYNIWLGRLRSEGCSPGGISSQPRHSWFGRDPGGAQGPAASSQPSCLLRTVRFLVSGSFAGLPSRPERWSDSGSAHVELSWQLDTCLSRVLRPSVALTLAGDL